MANNTTSPEQEFLNAENEVDKKAQVFEAKVNLLSAIEKKTGEMQKWAKKGMPFMTKCVAEEVIALYEQL